MRPCCEVLPPQQTSIRFIDLQKGALVDVLKTEGARALSRHPELLPPLDSDCKCFGFGRGSQRRACLCLIPVGSASLL